MPSIHVSNIDATWPRDLIQHLGNEGFRVSLNDFVLQLASRWERRYFHVEDTMDFSENSVGLTESRLGYMTDDLPFDVHSRYFRKPRPWANGILFQEGPDPEGTTVTGFRHRDGLFINGRYYITIRMGIPDDANNLPPDDTTASLLLRFRTDSTVIEWRIPGSAFYDAGNQITGAFEYLPQESTGGMGPATVRLRAIEDSLVTHCYIDTSSVLLWGAGNYDPEFDYPDYGTRYLPSLSRIAADDYEMELVYQGLGDIFVDAICFSDPQGYGFFVGDNNALPNFQGGALRDSITTRLGNLGVDDATGNPLSFVELQESSPALGCLTTMNLITKIVDDLTGGNDTVNTFQYGHPSGSFDRLAEENYNIVSGMYQYMTNYRLPRPDTVGYYDSTFHRERYFWYGSRLYRSFAVACKNANENNPFFWMPAVGIASHSFRDGHPWTLDTLSLDPIFDTEEVREPTAAELQSSVNIYLAYGAKSIMYYHYSSIAPNHVRQGFPSVPAFDADNFPINRGAMGLINPDTSPRTSDLLGENKWDSTRNFNVNYLRSMGDSLFPLRWENGLSYDDGGQNSDACISKILSERLNTSIDGQLQTYVELGRFSSPTEETAVYLFVVNKRTDTLGGRHITVKLKPGLLDSGYYQVQNVFSKEKWIVLTMNNTDTLSRTGCFTDFFPSGGGALYKLTPIVFTGDGNPIAGCHPHHLHITKGADVDVSSDSIRFQQNRGLFIEGKLKATDVWFGPCSSTWLGIMVRDGGEFRTNPVSAQATCTVDLAPINVASNSYANLKRVHIMNTPGGLIASACTVATDGVWTTSVDTLGFGFIACPSFALHADSLERTGSGTSLGKGIEASGGGYGTIHGERVLSYDTALSIRGSTIDAVGDDKTWYGHNRLDGAQVAIYMQPGGEIDLCNVGSRNSINTNAPGGYHVVFETGGTAIVWADSNYWSGSGNPPWTILPSDYKWFMHNNVYYPNDPVPLTSGWNRSFAAAQKDVESSITPGQIFEAYRRAVKRGDTLHTLGLLVGFIRSDSSIHVPTACIPWLNALAIRTGREDLAQGILDMCAARSDLHSKLYASDLLAGFRKHDDALKVLNGYGFGADEEILKQALIRKAIFHPYSSVVGYHYGLACVDSLRNAYSSDFLTRRFVESYPYLYSGLHRKGGGQIVKRSAEQIRYPIPASIILEQNYPNPAAGVSAVTFHLPEERNVTITLYDALGRIVRQLANRRYDVGIHSLLVNARELAPGVYFYRMIAGDESLVRKMMVVR